VSAKAIPPSRKTSTESGPGSVLEPGLFLCAKQRPALWDEIANPSDTTQAWLERIIVPFTQLSLIGTREHR
jgi:hypothetical protein